MATPTLTRVTAKPAPPKVRRLPEAPQKPKQGRDGWFAKNQRRHADQWGWSIWPHPDGDFCKMERKWLLKRLWVEQAGICLECDEWVAPEDATFDHIIPQSMGGPTCWSNGQMLCMPCNSMKSSHLPKGAREILDTSCAYPA